MKDLHNPIYIHSLFRSGSTYVFNTFRKNEEEYLCYQEPFHEYIGLSLFDKDKLLKIDEKTSLSLRHQKLDKPYFYEYSLNFEEISNNFNNSLSYKNFFKKDGLDEYIKVLSNVPEKRPVLQMCRSFGRVKFINDVKKGLNIYLWRNPWDQWWSYKITDYFYTTNLLIINAENDSPFLQEIKSLLDVKWFSSDNVEEELGYYHNVKLSSYDNYLLFYSLWCYSFLSCIDLCEIDINIDSLTSSEEYRTNIIQELNKYSISGIDFDDAKSPVGYFSDQDKEFFLKIEKTINSLLKKYYTNSQFERLYKNLSEKNPHLDSIEKEPNLKKEISNIRSLINRYEDRMAEFYSVKDKQLEKHIEDLTSSHTKEIQKLLNLNNDLKIEMGKLIESRDESLLIIKAESKRALDAEITYNNYRAEVNKTLDFHHNVINSLSWRITKPIRDFDRVYLETRHKIKQFYDKKIILNLEEFAIKSLYKRKTKPIFFESFLRKRIRRELLIDITHIYQEDLKTGIQRIYIS